MYVYVYVYEYAHAYVYAYAYREGENFVGGIFCWRGAISYFKCVRNFLLNVQATVRNKPGAKFSHWGFARIAGGMLCVSHCLLPPPPPLFPGPGTRTPSLAGGFLYAHSPRGRPGEGGKAPGLSRLCFSLPSLLSFSIMHKFSILDAVSEY